jgi:uncharacterized protein (DUF58 family)
MARSSFEFDGVVRPTRVGATYLVSTVALAIAAVNTGNNSLYIAVAFMLGCLLLSGLASKGGLKHLEIEIAEIDEAWAGRRAEGVLKLRNRSRVWAVRDVILTSEALAAPLLVPLAPRRREVALQAAFLFARRGRIQLSAIDAYTRYPFGLFLKKRRLRVGSEVVVFPRILAEDLDHDRFHAVAGDEGSTNRPGSGSEIHSFRDYARGDSVRHVHWKKSASLGRWIVKQTEADVSHSVNIVVDPYVGRAASGEAFEQMISEAATFAFHAARRGLDLIVSLPRLEIRVRGSESPSAIFRALALLEPSYEPFQQIVDRDAVVFSMGGRFDSESLDPRRIDAKSA